MRHLLALLILISSALYSNCVKRTYDIKVSLVGQNQPERTIGNTKASLVVDNIQTYSPLDVKLNAPHAQLIEENAQDCQNCVFLLEFTPSGQNAGQTQKLYTSIKADLVLGKRFEDFLEVAVSENNDVLSVKYGISRYYTTGESEGPTVIKERSVSQSVESPELVPDASTSYAKEGVTKTVGGVGGGDAEDGPQQEQSFFKKYFWWIIIGGFVVVQFMSIDKEKLMDAANQAQNPPAQRR